MSHSRAGMGGGGGGSAGIPASSRKVVQSLKEIVGNSDDEIYAMLKECNMDLDETAQRLLNQDPFHEVKRKRDKKKEGGPNKDSSDMRGRSGSGGFSNRGGRGSGRGSSISRNVSQDHTGGRGKPFARENGIHPSTRGPSAASTPSPSAPIYSQPKPVPSGSSSTGPASTVSSSGSLPNGSSLYSRSPPVPQGAWGSGHATMADMLKSNGAPPNPPILTQASSPTMVQPAVSQSYLSGAPIASTAVSSGFYSSPTDPVLHPSLDPRATGPQGAIKRVVGTVGHQRPIGDRPSTSITNETATVSMAPSQPSHITQAIVAPASGNLETEVQSNRPSTPPLAVSPPLLQDPPVNQAALTEPSISVGSQTHQVGGAIPTGMTGTAGSRQVLGGSQFTGRPAYPPQQQPPVGTQKEWKPKGAVQNSLGVVTEAPEPPIVARETSRMTSQLHALNMHDDQPVIIPNHLQVPEADRTRLSFGSFTAGFGTSFSAGFGAEEANNSSLTIVESAPAVETPVEQPTPASVVVPVALAQSYVHPAAPAPVENMISSDEVASVTLPAQVAPQLELPKPDPVVQQIPQYPYLPAVTNYPTFNLIPQMPVGQYSYEPADTQTQDVSRLPNLMQPYTDPSTSYYPPAFRPGTDGDARYPPFMTSNTPKQYNGNMGLMTGASLPSNQESGNSMLASSGPSSAPTSQPLNNPQTPSMAQQALPMHAYSAQPPPGHFGNMFGYQYVPSNYTYMHAPYQHNYSPGNSAYAQPPTGSTYPPASPSAYPAGGGAPVKYPLTQYKSGASGNAPHSAAAGVYGGYTTAPSGYATIPTVTAANATGYDDVGGPQYKDNTLYIPNQQGEGVWIQTPVPRDMGPTAGMQTSSYYNLAGQGQHSAYGHTQQPTHTHPAAAYANVYQSGPAPNAHQLLQQPQAMGGGGAGSGQAGAYQQPQRAQQTWPNSY